MESTIDFLIGAEYYCRLLDHTSQTIVGNPSAVPSVLDWLLLGRFPFQCSPPSYHSFFVKEDPIAAELQKFWEVEELPYYHQ